MKASSESGMGNKNIQVIDLCEKWWYCLWFEWMVIEDAWNFQCMVTLKRMGKKIISSSMRADLHILRLYRIRGLWEKNGAPNSWWNKTREGRRFFGVWNYLTQQVLEEQAFALYNQTPAVVRIRFWSEITSSIWPKRFCLVSLSRVNL